MKNEQTSIENNCRYNYCIGEEILTEIYVVQTISGNAHSTVCNAKETAKSSLAGFSHQVT